MSKTTHLDLGSTERYTHFYYVDSGKIGEIDDKDYVEKHVGNSRPTKMTVSEYEQKIGFDANVDYLGNRLVGSLPQLMHFNAVFVAKTNALRQLLPDHPHRDSVAKIYDQLLFTTDPKTKAFLVASANRLMVHPEYSEEFCDLIGKKTTTPEAMTETDTIRYEAHVKYDGMPELLNLVVRFKSEPKRLTANEMAFLTDNAQDIYITAFGPIFSQSQLDLALQDFKNPKGWYQTRGTAQGADPESFAYRNEVVAGLQASHNAYTQFPNETDTMLRKLIFKDQMHLYGFGEPLTEREWKLLNFNDAK